ncbi:DeoR/GlpR transcriptional regulator [Cohnella pontilimi]|uniref:DeoR/GlpR transcriptional regulator n=1 Tax=Cohnella pontilimi TaxID=2564100 RepID=A0A4U0FBF3_9BACL|nr:DeoR/GlpR family DNA-binding transcription regulator [Cohnella pontilimi]TJY41504.1 DeoR/GlpR transcriptional regulator [Cohnella pontilimi]
MARIGLKTERQERLLRYLQQHGSITVSELTGLFHCSEATARRDLEELEQNGRIIRTMGGGAKYAEPGLSREIPFLEKQNTRYAEKQAIASAAAELVQEGDVVGLTGGTTTFLIARALKRKRRITVVTNAVNIAMELADHEDIQVVLTGGVLRNKSYELCGPLAEQTVEALNIHTMFMGIDGLTADQGASTYSELEANIAKLLMKRSDRTIAVFDHTKAGRSSLFRVAALAELHACISNAPIPDDIRQAMEMQGVNLHVADAALITNGGTRP